MEPASQPSSQESGSNKTAATTKDSLALKILHAPNTLDRQGSKVVDIIFVHGLGGLAKKTWTHSSSKAFWPDFFHEEEEFSNARISTFEYDSNLSNIFGANNILDISGFAKLLNRLHLHYSQYRNVRGPET